MRRILIDEAELLRLRAIEEQAARLWFWNDSPEPAAQLEFDDAMFELGRILTREMTDGGEGEDAACG